MNTIKDGLIELELLSSVAKNISDLYNAVNSTNAISADTYNFILSAGYDENLFTSFFDKISERVTNLTNSIYNTPFSDPDKTIEAIDNIIPFKVRLKETIK